MPGSETEIAALVSAVETWRARRVGLAEGFNLRGFREFCEVMNYWTRKLISVTEQQDPDFWSALSELAVNAQTLTTRGAKLKADHRDMTQY